MKNLIATLVVVVALLAVIFGGLSVAGGYLSDGDTIWNAQRQAPERRPVEAANLNLTPGVFAGVGGGGFHGNVSVELTVDENGVITGIEVVDSDETARFAEPVFVYLTDSVLEAQHGGVDVLASATFTSTAFLNAVRDAISRSAVDEATEEPEPVTGTVFAGRGGGGHGSGDVVLEVTISEEGRIVHIEVIEHSETLGFASHAFPYLTESVMEAQSADVDVVASATLSSTAFLNAVRDALAVAAEAE